MSHSSRKVIYAALAGNTLIAITKFAASSITGSSAMLSEGIHSLVDTGNQVLLLYGLKQAQKPADERFPFGHGKEIYFWSFVVAILIFAVGAGISIYEGILHILDPVEIKKPYINYIVLSLGIIFEGAAWYFALNEFRKVKGQLTYIEAVQRGKDPTMFVVLFEDSAALIGLLVALIGVWLSVTTGNPIYDGIASILIGMILGATAVWLAIETKSLLIGERADPKVIHGIRKIVSSYEAVEHVNEVLTLHMGPEYILVNISIDFNDQITVDHLENLVEHMTQAIKAEHSFVKRVFIEASD